MKVIFSDNTETEWVWFAYGISKQTLPLAPVPAIAALQTALSNINIQPVPDLGRQLQAVDATPPKVSQAPARMPNQYEDLISQHCPTGRDYCVLKMTAFDSRISAAEYVSTFNTMATTAIERGIKKLLFDVNSNGGGTIPLGFLATKSLMPTLDATEICDRFSAKLGPLNQFLVDQGWYGTPFGNLLTEKVLDMNATNKYALALAQNNCAGFNNTVSNIDSILTALLTLYNATPTARLNQNQQALDRIQFYKDLVPTVKQACLDGNIIPPPSIPSTSDEFPKYLAGYLQRLQNFFSNIATQLTLGDEFGSLTTIDVAGEVLNYTVPQTRLPPRGFCHDTYFGKLDPIVSSPFGEILAISDGMCGSTCGFFGLSALFHSLRDASLPSFRFVVHGGLGTSPQDQILTPTVFQGGNVFGKDMDEAADMWGFYASTAIFTWASNLTLPRLDELEDLIPDFQKYSQIPQYPFRMGHSNALGKESLP